MKARIVKKTIGVMDYYKPQLLKETWLFSYWKDLGYVFLSNGRVSWYEKYDSLYEAQEKLSKYERLFGITLEIEKHF